MRLWSLSPSYLDVKGLVAVWREGLLAKAVLLGQTKGYTHHPQLVRFQKHPEPITAIDYYLEHVLLEAKKRGYHFDESKIQIGHSPKKILVTIGQIEYEFQHLKQKIAVRSPERLPLIQMIHEPTAHPLFNIIPGEIEPWEKVIMN